MSGTFFEAVGRIAATLAGDRSLRDKFDVIRPLLTDSDVTREFWAQLNTGDWVAFLASEGMFDDPPHPQNLSGGRTRYPIWPASKYLRRIAKSESAQVAKVFAGLTSDNPSVFSDMVDAGLDMPPDHAATLVPAICSAAKSGTLWMAFKDATDLCIALANGRQVRAALTLADALFSSRAESGKEELSGRNEHWYGKGLEEVTPVLAALAPQEYLEQLCGWLETSVKSKSYASTETGEDLSTSWRPAIEDDEQNRDYEIASMLAGAVRNGFEAAVEAGGLSLDQALEMLKRFRFVIFQRIGIHLMAEYARRNESLARQSMLRKDLFDDYRVKHEYARLVGEHLSLLTESELGTWYGWIEAGPDLSDFEASFRSGMGREATAEDRKNRVDYWKFERLHWVRAHLTGSQKAFYEKMLGASGEPELADLSFRVTSRWGNESPVPAAELSKLAFSEVVNRLKTWKPDAEARRRGFHVDGLAGAFSQLLASDPVRFSVEARELEAIPAMFVRTYISQMGEAAKKGASIDVPAVLALCGWVVKQQPDERTTPAEAHERLIDPDWRWTRDEVSRFVENVCTANTEGVPRYAETGIRESMWNLLEQLYKDPSKSNIVHDTTQDDPRVYDFLDLGINSARGRAVEAALEYARWRANHMKVREGNRDVVPRGFNAMPEVAAMLDWQMQAENRTLEAMSVIGSRMGLIYWIDQAWLAANADALFDLPGIDRTPTAAEGWAAWNAFLVWVPAHMEFYRLFEKQFAFAVEQATKLETVPEKSRMQPMHHLGEHLVLLYGRGQLGLDDHSGLFRKFVEKSHPDLRRHAISFVGRSLTESQELPDEVVNRFMALWEGYWKGPGRADAERERGEWLFGQWFASGKFPVEWSLVQLKEFASVVGMPEPDHAVAERLAAVAGADIDASLDVLSSMIQGDTDGWHVHGWLDHASAVLKLGVETGGHNRERAIKLINDLGRRGLMDFGKLLPK